MVPCVVGDVAISEKPACFQVSRDVMWLLWFWGTLVDVWCTFKISIGRYRYLFRYRK
jgi:hypothetical protein